MKVLDWYGCYNQSWKDRITPESMAHPAKFSRALIRRIYAWLIENNHLTPGDGVLDPFGGVALGACDALSYGLNWQGVELELKFVDLGMGFHCQGMSKADWIRFYGRWNKVNYRDGRRWCPRCVAQAEAIEDFNHIEMFSSQTASYRRNSGQIPFTRPHHYEGNIHRFQKYAKGRATATLLRGDSRQLLVALNGQAKGVVTSPPWGNVEGAKAASKFSDPEKAAAILEENHRTGAMNYASKEAILSAMERAEAETYGEAEGNLGNMSARATDFEAVVTSPPFAGNSGGRGEASRNGIDAGLFERHQGAMVGGIGDGRNGNLASMLAKGADFEAVITSPPYVESLASDDPDKRGGLFKDPKRRNDKTLTAVYGASPGQVGAMGAGDFEGVVTSPPYEDSINQGSGTANLEARKRRLSQAGIDINHKANIGGPNGGFSRQQIYGQTDGQMGVEAGETFWSAARLILEQAYQALVPGGVAVFVTKDFVKNGQRIPFSDQWGQLCEAVGFAPEARFRAWLVEERGAQYDLNGNLVIRTVERKSFFRRLAEKNGSPRIDWEDILVFRKVELAEQWTK